jgi:hypothetical protein
LQVADFPDHLESDEYGLWSTDARSVLPPDALAKLGSVRTRTISNFTAFARLATILERVISALYVARRADDGARLASLAELDLALGWWGQQFPAALGSLAPDCDQVFEPPHIFFVKLVSDPRSVVSAIQVEPS